MPHSRPGEAPCCSHGFRVSARFGSFAPAASSGRMRNLMVTDSNLLSLILFLLFGGGTDLVSYIPPQIYWESKGVEMVTIDALLPDIAVKEANVDVEKLVTALGPDDAGTREGAATSLLSAGPAIVAALDKEANSPDV